jgi:hypothetical protein
MMRAEIDAATDEEVDRIILDALSRRLGWVGVRHEYDSVRRLSPGLRMLWSTDVVDGEIQNGGFNQLFWNRYDLYAADAIEGFRLIGAEEHARLVEDALKGFEEERPRLEPFYAEGTLEAFSKSCEHTGLEGLEAEWLFQGLDFRAKRLSYIRAHPEEFVLDN